MSSHNGPRGGSAEESKGKDEKVGFVENLQDFPQYGAYFLAATWLSFRVISVFATMGVVGAIGYTIGSVNQSLVEPPALLVRGMVIAIVAEIYSVISTFVWYHRANRGLWIMMCFDVAFFGLFCYLSIALSEPAIHPQCHTNNAPHAGAAAGTTSANVMAGELSSRLGRRHSLSSLAEFVLVNHIPCANIMAFWVPCLALSGLFFCTALLEPMLWYRCRKGHAPRGYGKPSKKQMEEGIASAG